MSSVPRPDPKHDPGLSDVASMLAELAATLKAANDQADRNRLSAEELRIAANVKTSAPCILEEDATLSFMGREIGLTLRAYGRWHKAFRGQFERGGLQLTPDEPAHYEIDSVTICTGPGSIEQEIYNALNDEALEVVGDAAYEADPQ